MPRLGAAQPLDKQLLLHLPAVQPSRRRLLLEELHLLPPGGQLILELSDGGRLVVRLGL